jgi:hypothetical protein
VSSEYRRGYRWSLNNSAGHGQLFRALSWVPARRVCALVLIQRRTACSSAVRRPAIGVTESPCRWDDDTRRSFAVIASAQLNSEWLKLFRVGDCLMPAKYYLQKPVNENLRNRVSPQLL